MVPEGDADLPATVDIKVPEGLKGADLRDHLADKLYDVMTDMIFRTSPIDRTLMQALLDARATHGGNHVIVEDISATLSITNRVVMGSFILGRRIARAARTRSTSAFCCPMLRDAC